MMEHPNYDAFWQGQALDKLIADERVQAVKPSAHQLEMLGRIRGVLNPRPPDKRRPEGARVH